MAQAHSEGRRRFHRTEATSGKLTHSCALFAVSVTHLGSISYVEAGRWERLDKKIGVTQRVTQPPVQPEVPPAKFGFVESAEILNSRAAMVRILLHNLLVIAGNNPPILVTQLCCCSDPKMQF